MEPLLSIAGSWFVFDTVRISNGTYFSFFTGNSRQDMKTIGIHVNRKVMLDGNAAAVKRAIGIEVLNNGMVPSNGYRVAYQVNGGPVVTSNPENRVLPLPAYTDEDAERPLCTDTVWLRGNAGFRFDEKKLYKIKAWVIYDADSSRENDTLVHEIDLRPLPIGDKTKFSFETATSDYTTWSYNFAFPNGGIGVLPISYNLVAESKALDSIQKSNFTNWLDPRFEVKTGTIQDDKVLAMGYEGITCTQPNDGARTLTTSTLGPIGPNATVKFKYQHGLKISNSNSYRAMRAQDTVYVEATANDGQSWTHLYKLHQGNQNSTFTPATIQASIPFANGSLIRVRIRYQSLYQPLLATPYPSVSLLVNDLEITSDALTEKEDLVEQANERSLLVYPNPARGLFTLKLKQNELSAWEVLDSQGRKVEAHLQTDENGWPQIDIRHLPNGIYLLRTVAEHQLKITKIIKGYVE